MFGGFVVWYWFRHAQTGCIHEQRCIAWRHALEAYFLSGLARDRELGS